MNKLLLFIYASLTLNPQFDFPLSTSGFDVNENEAHTRSAKGSGNTKQHTFAHGYAYMNLNSGAVHPPRYAGLRSVKLKRIAIQFGRAHRDVEKRGVRQAD